MLFWEKREIADRIALHRLAKVFSYAIRETKITVPFPWMYEQQLAEIGAWADTLPRIERRAYRKWLAFYARELRRMQRARECDDIQTMWRRPFPFQRLLQSA